MTMSYQWQSYQGTVTKDNRDYCGVATRSDSTLYVVIDGATRGPLGGALAKELAHSLVENFLKDDASTDIEKVCNQLQQSHKDLRHKYPADSASYMILLDTHDGNLMTAHAGDCRLGKIKQDETIEWFTKTHSLANAVSELTEAELVAHPNRHKLTRSFRPQRFMKPECGQFSFKPDDNLIIATDGFWAEMNAVEQSELIEGRYIPSGSKRDDRSCLLLKAPPQTDQIQNSENIYIQPK